MTTHLATRGGILCHTEARYPAKSGDLRDVTCTRCHHRFPVEMAEEAEAHYERRREEAVAEAAEFLGAEFLWALVQQGDSATARMTRDIVGAVLIGLAEQHRPEAIA